MMQALRTPLTSCRYISLLPESGHQKKAIHPKSGIIRAAKVPRRVGRAHAATGTSNPFAHEPRSAHAPPAGKAHRLRTRKHKYDEHSTDDYAEGPLELNKQGQFDPLVVGSSAKEANPGNSVTKSASKGPDNHWKDFWSPRLFWLFKALGTAID